MPVTRVRWSGIWTRAVVVPAARRAGAAWVGCVLVAAVIFGPSGMRPSDLTGLALHDLGVGAVLIATWILIFVPTARVLVRAERASFLRSLPAPALAPIAIGGAALVALQLPWLALWTIGEGIRGLGVVALTTLTLVGLAAWQPRGRRPGVPVWRGPWSALSSIHLRALRRRAQDAVVRGAGLAVLAGVAGGLFVANNQLAGEAAAILGGSVIAVVLVPATTGALLVLVESHRATAWLAHSLAIAGATRTLALVLAVAAVQLAGAAIAVTAAAIVADANSSTVGWLAAVSLALAIGSALGCTRVLLGREDAPSIAARTVIGAVVVAAAAVLCLGVFGVAGVVAFLAAAALALAVLR